MGYLATIYLRYVLIFLVLRWSFTGESTTTIYSRFTSLVRYDSTILVYRDSLLVVAKTPRHAGLSLTACPYGAPFSHLFTELKISAIEVHGQLNWRYLQFN